MEYQVKDDKRVDSAVHKKIRKLGLAEDDSDEEDEGFLISLPSVLWPNYIHDFSSMDCSPKIVFLR